MLEATRLNFATTFEDFEIQLDHPAFFVVVDDRFDLFLAAYRQAGQQQSLDRLAPFWWIGPLLVDRLLKQAWR